MQRYRLIVMSNPVDGKEEAYNEWYTTRHLADVLRVPGVVAAQRFVRSQTQRDGAGHAWKYLAIYDCETDDIGAVIAEMKRRAGTLDMTFSDAFDASNVFACYFEPITEIRRSA